MMIHQKYHRNYETGIKTRRDHFSVPGVISCSVAKATIQQPNSLLFEAFRDVYPYFSAEILQFSMGHPVFGPLFDAHYRYFWKLFITSLISCKKMQKLLYTCIGNLHFIVSHAFWGQNHLLVLIKHQIKYTVLSR